MGFPRLDVHDFVVVDTETTGLHWWRDRIFGIALGLPMCGRIEPHYWDVRETPGVLPWLRDNINGARRLVFHNAKFDLHMLREAGAPVDMAAVPVVCTMIRAALLDEHLHQYDLDSLALMYTDAVKDRTLYGKMADLFGGKPTRAAQMGNIHRAPSAMVGEYARSDVIATGALHLYQEPLIEKEELGVVDGIERKLLDVLVELERGGCPVDVPRAERAMGELAHIISTDQKKLDKLAGFPVNPNPSDSIHRLFQPEQIDDSHFRLVDGTVVGATTGGKASIDKDALRRIVHPAGNLIFRLRTLKKTRDTFLAGHVLGHHHNGVVHANYNQTKSENERGTGTGRMSVNDPALQQIHKRDKDIAAIVRAMFIPDKGQVWHCADWSQMDFRIFAHYTNEPKLIEHYARNPNADFHQIVSDLTGLPRDPPFAGAANAKQLNLGLVFGMGEGKMAQEMGLPFEIKMVKFGGEDVERPILVPGEEAEAMFRRYHAAIPGIRALLKMASGRAKRRGYVKTALGRRIRFPHGKFTHKAGGLIFQGTAADSLKVKLIELDDYFRSTGNGRMLLNVHDEFDSSVLKSKLQRVDKDVRGILECFDGSTTPFSLRVPIRSSSGTGPNWWEASK